MPPVAKPAEQSAEVKAGEHNPFVHSLLTQAKELDDEKEALYKRIGANRDILRNIKLTGLLSADQAKAVDEFYPLKQKKAAAAESNGTDTPPSS